MTFINLNEERAKREPAAKAAATSGRPETSTIERARPAIRLVGGQFSSSACSTKEPSLRGEMGQVALFDGKRWAEDETLNVFTLSRRLCHEMAETRQRCIEARTWRLRQLRRSRNWCP